MRFRFLPALALAAAVALTASGCAGVQGSGTDVPDSGGTPESRTSTQLPDVTRPTASEIESLISTGDLPAGFRADESSVRLLIDGDKVAATWTGPRLGSCEDGAGSPGSFAALLLLQDVPLQDIQRCDGFWQATQADGSHLLWNDAGNAKN